ncbi:response regulator transcription factor [Gorillibacterium timonense]|uniref:response regulator transcription factor n=1 Tax=Gorillibacterium timonense TaxID=1689269 RepID=UPI00071CB95D|nr:response regulator transcription factor [Gorillibacterium timonense]
MASVLVADDDPHIRELVRLFLEKEGFKVYEAVDGQAALELMQDNPVDLAVLDIMMPRVDGWTVCRRLRSDYDIPILLLTAKGQTADKVRGFELGADDYLAKPFDPLELAARVKALFKRYRIAASSQVSAAELLLDRQAYRLLVRQTPVQLPPKEFELLFLLASHLGRTLTREQLIETVWGYDFDGNERTLDVHINRLRERLIDWSVTLRITTVRGLGYRLEEAVYE